MSTRRAPSDDSLELLLDTISNAFGGILFLAILLALLLRLSHPKSEAVAVAEEAQLELVELEAELAQATARLSALDDAVAVQQDARTRLADPTLERQYVSLAAARRNRDGLEQLLAQARQSAAHEQKRLDELANEMEEQEAELARVTQAVEKARERLKRERDSRTSTFIPPQTRRSTKREISLVLRYGKMYRPDKFDYAALERSVNLDQFAVVGVQGGELMITPIPTAGTPVVDAASLHSELRNMLANHDASSWHVCVLVWEDSFAAFPVIKKRLIELGYEYRLLSVETGGVIHEAPNVDGQVQ